MAQYAVIPKLGLTMSEGTITALNKKIGDEVSKGEVIAEFETDKITGEVESPISGFVLDVYASAGDTLKVLSRVCLVGQKGEKASPDQMSDDPINDNKQEVKTYQREPKAPKKYEGERVFASPLAKKLAEENGIDIKKIKGSGTGGRIEKEDILAEMNQTRQEK